MTQRQKLIFQIIGIFLFIILFIRPAAVSLSNNIATHKQLVKRLTQLEVKLKMLEGIDEPLNDDRVKKMESVFPSTKPIVILLSNLSQLAAEYNLDFGGVTLTPGSLSENQTQAKNKKKSATELNDLVFGFEIGGDFDRISQFLQALENMAPLMKIEEVGLSIKTNPLFDREATQVVANIKVAAYYQAPPLTLGSIDKPVELLSRSEENLLNQLIGFKTYPPVVPDLSPVGKADLFQ